MCCKMSSAFFESPENGRSMILVMLLQISIGKWKPGGGHPHTQTQEDKRIVGMPVFSCYCSFFFLSLRVLPILWSAGNASEFSIPNSPANRFGIPAYGYMTNTPVTWTNKCTLPLGSFARSYTGTLSEIYCRMHLLVNSFHRVEVTSIGSSGNKINQVILKAESIIFLNHRFHYYECYVLRHSILQRNNITSVELWQFTTMFVSNIYSKGCVKLQHITTETLTIVTNTCCATDLPFAITTISKYTSLSQVAAL